MRKSSSPTTRNSPRQLTVDSTGRKPSSELSADIVLGQGTARSPRRFGHKGKLSNEPDVPNYFLFPLTNTSKASPTKNGKGKRRLSENTEANVKTPEWEEFDLERVRNFYSRTGSQSRGVGSGGISKRRKSSCAVLSPSTLVGSDGNRRGRAI